MTDYEQDCERLYSNAKAARELLERVIKRNQGGFSGDRDDIETALGLLERGLYSDNSE